MKILLILFCFLFTGVLSAQIYGLDWAIVAQDTLMHSQNFYVLEQESDVLGNVYVCGEFRERADMDPSSNNSIIAANSNDGNFFIAKYDNQGNILWAKDFGGSADSDITGLDIDDSGNLYLTGQAYGLFYYDTDSHGVYSKATHANVMRSSGFILKYTTNGDFDWIKRLETNFKTFPEDIEVSSQGKIIISGYFQKQAYFNNSTSLDTLNSGGFLNKDAFLAQYDQNGENEWAFAVGGNGDDNGIRIASDNAGSIYVLSEIEDTVDLDPSGNTYEVIQGSLFQQSYGQLYGANTIAKYDSTGSFVWGHLFQDVGGFIRMQDIDINSLNQIGVTGVYSNDQMQSFDFDPSTGTAFINGTNTQRSYVARYDSSLSFLSTVDIGLTYYHVNEITFNSNNDIFAVGHIRSFLNDPQEGFISKCDASGGLVFSKVIEADEEVFDLNVSINGVDEPIVSAQYNKTVDLDPSLNIFNVYTPSSPSSIVLSFLANYSVNGDFQYGFYMSDYSSSGVRLNDFATYIETDLEGNIFARGVLNGTVDFDPSSSSDILETHYFPNRPETFVVKYDSSANYKWGFTIDSLINEGRLTVDNQGNCYISATNIGVTDLDPSSGTALFTNQGTYTGLMAKYDPAGNILWAFQLENLSTNSLSTAQDILIDSTGNILVCGAYLGDIDFDPSPSQFILSNPIVGNVWSTPKKTFLAKYDPNGNLIWAVDFGGLQTELIDLAVNDNDDIFLTGAYKTDIDIDPSAATFTLNAVASKNILLAKYDSSANFQWGFGLGNMSNNWGTAVAAGSNHVYLTGIFSGTCDMDPGPNVLNLTSINTSNPATFVARFDALNGDLDWVFDLNGANSQPRGMDINSDENIVVHGVLKNNWFFSEFPIVMDVDPSPDTVGLVSTHDPTSLIHGMYTVVYDSLGNLQWAMDMQESTMFSELPRGPSLACYDKEGNILISGSLEYDGDFAPREAELVLETRNGSEFFLAKYSACTSTYATQSASACGSYDWQGNNYTSSGVYYDTISNHRGCDSIMSITLNILPVDSLQESVIACDSYTWTDGVTYASSGTYYNYLTNSSGCDSILALNLTIPPLDTTHESVSACGSFTWSDGDTYTNSGTYYNSLTNSLGCDSTLVLALTIQNIDTTLNVQNDTVLMANQSGATYQWIDCDNLQLISGANNQSYTPETSGVYAAVIDIASCLDTTACETINFVDLDEEQILSQVQVYPNPTISEFNIDFGESLSLVDLKLLDATGRVYRSGFGRLNTQINNF